MPCLMPLTVRPCWSLLTPLVASPEANEMTCLAFSKMPQSTFRSSNEVFHHRNFDTEAHHIVQLLSLFQLFEQAVEAHMHIKETSTCQSKSRVLPKNGMIGNFVPCVILY